MIAGVDYNSYRGKCVLAHVGQPIGNLAPEYHTRGRACDHTRLSEPNNWPKWPPDRTTD
jgi:hypothetical protein